MFSPMTTSQVVTAIGRAAREAARGDGPASEFSRGQLMSAFSASRHLAVELAEFPAELHEFASRVAHEIQQTQFVSRADELAALSNDLEKAADAARVGDLVSATLDLLREDSAPVAKALRANLHRALRALSDREVDLLAEVIEGPRA
jgi:hypothetical protein